MLKATLISIDNDDLEGISFDKIREFEDKLGLLPVDEDTKRNGMEATYAERVKMLEEDHSKFKVRFLLNFTYKSFILYRKRKTRLENGALKEK